MYILQIMSTEQNKKLIKIKTIFSLNQFRKHLSLNNLIKLISI